MSDDPAGEFIDAINQLNRACAKMGILNVSVIGLRTARAVNVVETVKATRRRVDLREVQGGFEVAGVAIKVRWQ